MGKPFRGTINVDIRDSVPDWAPFEPYQFTGGTIKRVAIDVSGTPYVDLERHATAMLARE
jgi:hypothetical protein